MRILQQIKTGGIVWQYGTETDLFSVIYYDLPIDF
jgi:hypothetical protein